MLWCGLAQKHQQGPITCSKWFNDSVQDKGIECIGFESFNQVRIEGSIGVSKRGPNTSYPCARGAQDNLIWAMRWGQQRKQKNPTTTSKQHARSKTKALKEALNALVLKVSTKSQLKGPLEYQKEALVHLIHMQEEPNTTLFGPWGEDNKGNKRILLQLGNNMGDYLFLLFLGLIGCMEGYK